MRYVVHFSGRVQGVGFRATCVGVSRDLDIHGFVRNESDGGVLLDVDGQESDLKELLRRIELEMHGKINDITIDSSESKQRSGGLRIAF